MRLLIVVLTRPELFADRPAWGGGLLSATALSLEPLAAGEALELATQLLTRGAGDYAAQLAATAEGNPLFIEELAAVVAERGSSDAQALPTTIRSILEARLDALEPDERAVLLDASVAGKVFWRGLIEKLQSRTVGIGELLGRARGARPDPPRGRLAHPGRAAVLVQARPDPPGGVRVRAACTPARASRRGRTVPRGGDDRDGRVGLDPRVPLERGRRRRPRGRVLHGGRRSRGTRLGEGACGRALQRGVQALAGGRRPPSRRSAPSARSRSRRCTTCRTRRASPAAPSSNAPSAVRAERLRRRAGSRRE